LGRLHIDGGHVVVLGNRPGAPGHGVPGSLVGYMPQVYIILYFLVHTVNTMYYNRTSSELSKHGATR